MKQTCTYLCGWLFLALLCVSCALMSFVLHHSCIDLSLLEHYEPGRPTQLLDDEGRVWAQFALDRRKVITSHEVPMHLIHAFLAAEDWQFFEHHGLSFKGIIRSLCVNMYHRRAVQGASTITQQLVRLLYFHHKKTFRRKIQEQCMALLVEWQFSKEQILQAYLNHVYFGCGIYGVEAAAQRFWGISAADVTIDQAAALAAVMRSPGTYCPLLHPDATQRRRNLVLGNMVKLGFITQEDYEQCIERPIEVVAADEQFGLHLREHIRQFLEARLGAHELYTGGYVVQTTVHADMQQKAEQSFKEHIVQLKEKMGEQIEGALMTVSVHSGEIKALVGGSDFGVSKFNRAMQARRQLGSVFKPLIFASALAQGKRFDDVVIDEPVSINDGAGRFWEPNNYNLQFNGPITLAYALSRSNNIGTIKTFLDIDPHAVVDLAKQCHLDDPRHCYPSLSLGCLDTTLDKAIGMFNVFANDGCYVQPHTVRWIKDRWGKKIYKVEPQKHRVMPSVISGKVLKVMSIGLERVRKIMPDQWIDSVAASKTGTTNDSRTCWFIGATPELTTGVYVGPDDNRSMGRHVYPLHTAFPIWIGLHRQIATKKKHFSYDPSLQEYFIDEKTGEVVTQQRDGAIAIFA